MRLTQGGLQLLVLATRIAQREIVIANLGERTKTIHKEELNGIGQSRQHNLPDIQVWTVRRTVERNRNDVQRQQYSQRPRRILFDLVYELHC